MRCSCDNFQGIGGFLKILTLLLGVITVNLTAQRYSKPFLQSQPFDPADYPHLERMGIKVAPKPNLKEEQKAFAAKVNSTSCQEEINKAVKAQEKGEEYTLDEAACRKVIHVAEDETVLSLVIIMFILSTIWLLILFLGVLKNPRIIDMILHILGGVLLIIAGIIWFISVSFRVVKETCGSPEEMKKSICQRGTPEFNKDAEKNLPNLIKLKEKFGCTSLGAELLRSGRREGSCGAHNIIIRPSQPPKFGENPPETAYTEMVVDGVFILVNGVVYLVIGILALLNKGGNTSGGAVYGGGEGDTSGGAPAAYEDPLPPQIESKPSQAIEESQDPGPPVFEGEPVGV